MVLPPPESPSAALPQSTLDRLEEGLRSTSSAGLADVVKLVQMLSADGIDISVHQLAEIIEKDAVVTAKCIAASNKLGYNTHGVEVASIPQAVQVVGFEKVRTLAVSLMLLDTAATVHEAEPRFNTQLSLYTGVLARAWARLNEKVEPDRYFLCGSLRNFGRLLLTTHLLAKHREMISLLATGIDREAAHKKVFGLTPQELTPRLVERLALPAPVIRALSALPADAFRKPPVHEGEEIRLVSEFLLRHGELALDTTVKPPEYHSRTQQLLRQFSLLNLSHDQLDHLLDTAEKELRFYGEGTRLGQISQPMAATLAMRRIRYEPPPPVATTAPSASQPPETTPPPSLLTAPPMAIGGMGPAIAALSDELSRPMVRWEKVLSVAAAGFQQRWNAPWIGLFGGTHGVFRFLGPLPPEGAPAWHPLGFRAGEPNLLGLSAQRAEPLTIHDTREAKVQAAMPPWMIEAGLKAFFILPPTSKETAGLALLVGWAEPHKIQLPPEVLREQRTLLNLVATAQRLITLQ